MVNMNNWYGENMKGFEFIIRTCCTTCNREKHIMNAMNSFVMQQTTNTIIDDASTDRTAEMIKQFVVAFLKTKKCLLLN